MGNFNCGCKSSCTGLSIVASIIIGIITAFLRFTAVITTTPAFLWVLFGIAVVYLAIALILPNLRKRPDEYACTCTPLSTLLVGILGTILTSVILLAIEFVATSIIGAIITGALLLFFSLIITSTVCLVKCSTGCGD